MDGEHREVLRTGTQQIFNFVGYQYDLREGNVRPTLELWKTLNLKLQELITNPYCRVRHLMSLVGLLTATENQVHLWSTLDEVDPVTFEKSLEDPIITKKGDPKISPATLKMVA